MTVPRASSKLLDQAIQMEIEKKKKESAKKEGRARPAHDPGPPKALRRPIRRRNDRLPRP